MAPLARGAALVTGGNRGLGLELCRKLVAKGTPVIIASRDLAAGTLGHHADVGARRCCGAAPGDRHAHLGGDEEVLQRTSLGPSSCVNDRQVCLGDEVASIEGPLMRRTCCTVPRCAVLCACAPRATRTARAGRLRAAGQGRRRRRGGAVLGRAV